jgi:type IV pilus assembly protein PilN
MIQINLLPVREARRKADLRQQLMQLFLVLLFVGAGVGFAHSRISDQIGSSRDRVRQMQRDIDQFQPQLEQVDAFRKKKAGLEKKIDVIDGLDRARSGPVRMMDELATHAPDRLWLTGVSTKGNQIELLGQSLDNELVAGFLTALNESPYFDQVDLDSTELVESMDGMRVVSFKIQAVLVAPKPVTEG